MWGLMFLLEAFGVYTRTDDLRTFTLKIRVTYVFTAMLHTP